MFDSSFGWRFVNPKIQLMYGTDAMGVTADNLVELYHISREVQDYLLTIPNKKLSRYNKMADLTKR